MKIYFKVRFLKRFGISWCKWSWKTAESQNHGQWEFIKESLADQVKEIWWGTSRANDLNINSLKKMVNN